MAVNNSITHSFVRRTDIYTAQREYSRMVVADWRSMDDYRIPEGKENDPRVLCGVLLADSLYDCLVGVKKKNPRIQLLPGKGTQHTAHDPVCNVLIVNPAQPLVGVARVWGGYMPEVTAHIPRIRRITKRAQRGTMHTFSANDPKRVATLLNKGLSPLTAPEMFYLFGTTLGLTDAREFLQNSGTGDQHREKAIHTFLQDMVEQRNGLRCAHFWDSMCFLFDETGTVERPTIPHPTRSKWQEVMRDMEEKTHNMKASGGLEPLLFMKPRCVGGGVADFTYVVHQYTSTTARVYKKFDRDIQLPEDVATRMSMLGMMEAGEKMDANGRKFPPKTTAMFSDVQATFIHPSVIDHGFFDDWELFTEIKTGV